MAFLIHLTLVTVEVFWERLIKSVRRTLTAICVEQTLNDGILETAFVDVEANPQ